MMRLFLKKRTKLSKKTAKAVRISCMNFRTADAVRYAMIKTVMKLTVFTIAFCHF